ncbi:TonB family protein [Denitrovibrio acetiphilus DSM 12809]|uniref:TonB family protein n=1 Tax=Denitrovibrio acetiphilus (strain DSM 12809 / NBRC 114555 / N2460) TaxID=522772 RepID=D4H8L4_DENA2|nr:TonB family protein [Denitrovibrio acetiphilus]ADD68363.1 TonB family protein [Denitrovibrio acetiphilus DSM 12809]
MLKKYEEYKIFYVTVVLSIALHIMIAYRLDLNDKTVYAKLTPAAFSDVTVRYVKKRPVPITAKAPEETKPLMKVKPVIKKEITKAKVAKKKPVEKVKALEAPVFKEIAEPEPQVELTAYEQVKSLPEVTPESETFTQEAPLVEEVVPDAVPAPIDTSNLVSYEKLDKIRHKIKNNLSYPSAARRMGWTGVVKVEICLSPVGQLKNITILDSSGYKALDKIVLKSINKSAPFNVSFNKDIIISLPVSFTINGAEI